MSSWTDIDWSKVARGETELETPSSPLPPSPHRSPRPYSDPDSDDDSDTTTDSDDEDDEDMFSTMRLSKDMLDNFRRNNHDSNSSDGVDNRRDGSIESGSSSDTDSTGSVIIRESSDDDDSDENDDINDDDDDDDDDDWGATIRVDAGSMSKAMKQQHDNDRAVYKGMEEDEDEEDWDAELGLNDGNAPRMKLSLSNSNNDDSNRNNDDDDNDNDEEDWDAEMGIDTNTEQRTKLKLTDNASDTKHDRENNKLKSPPSSPLVKEDRTGMWAYVDAVCPDPIDDDKHHASASSSSSLSSSSTMKIPLRRMQHAMAAWEREPNNSNILILFGGRVDGYEPRNDLYLGHVHTRKRSNASPNTHSNNNNNNNNNNDNYHDNNNNTDQNNRNTPYITWEIPDTRGPSPAPRFGHAMVTDNIHHSLYIVGGHDGIDALSQLHRLDLNTLVWERLPDMPTPRYVHTAVLHASRIIVYGGCSGDEHPDTVDVFHIAENTWSTPQIPASTLRQDNNNNEDYTSPRPRRQHAAAVVGDLMYVVGGADLDYTYCQDIYALNLKTMEWNRIQSDGLRKPSPRIGHTAVSDRKGKLYVFGGRQESCFNDVWILENNKWRQSRFRGDVPQPRESHAACMLGSRMAIFGGINGMKILSDLHILETDPSRARRMPRHTRTATIIAPQEIAPDSTPSKLQLPSQNSSPESSSSTPSKASASNSTETKTRAPLHLPTSSVLSSAISSAHFLGSKGNGGGASGGAGSGDIYGDYMRLQQEVANKEKAMQSLERVLQRKNKEILQLTQNERSLKQEIEKLRKQLKQS